MLHYHRRVLACGIGPPRVCFKRTTAVADAVLERYHRKNAKLWLSIPMVRRLVARSQRGIR